MSRKTQKYRREGKTFSPVFFESIHTFHMPKTYRFKQRVRPRLCPLFATKNTENQGAAKAILHPLTLYCTVVVNKSRRRLSPLIFCIQLFEHGHQFITVVDKGLCLALWAIQQVLYQNRITANFCSPLLFANQAANKLTAFKPCRLSQPAIVHVFLTQNWQSKVCRNK